jgi:hypothetical protein
MTRGRTSFLAWTIAEAEVPFFTNITAGKRNTYKTGDKFPKFCSVGRYASSTEDSHFSFSMRRKYAWYKVQNTPTEWCGHTNIYRLKAVYYEKVHLMQECPKELPRSEGHKLKFSTFLFLFLSLHRAFWRFTYYHIPTNALIISFII